MNGGHSAHAQARHLEKTRPRPLTLLLIAALVVGVAVAAGFATGVLGGDAQSPEAAACGEAPQARIVVVNQALPSVKRALGPLTADEDGACPQVELIAAEQGELSSALKTSSGPPLVGVVAGPSDAAALRAKMSDRVGKPVVVAKTIDVVAMPTPLVEAIGWNEAQPDWRAVADVVLNTDAWSAVGRSDLGDFSLAMGDPATSDPTACAITSLVATALGRTPAELAPQDLGDERAQGTLLALDRVASVRATSTEQLVSMLAEADDRERLLDISAAFLDEQSVWAFNQTKPAVSLQAIYPTDGVATEEFTFTPFSDSEQTVLLEDVSAALTSSRGVEAFEREGFRRPDDLGSTVLGSGSGVQQAAASSAVAAPAAQVVGGVAQGWGRLANPGRFLVVMDVSGSMGDLVPGTGRSKLQYAQDAAITGMRLVPTAAEIGLWEFSTRLDGRRDYRELVSLGPVAETSGGRTRLDDLVSSVRGLSTVDDTGLYDTALASFRSVQRDYQEGEPNVVVLITDGRNEDTRGISLDRALAMLTREQDPEQPVRLLTIAYGADADVAALAKLSEATGGSAYVAPNPADIGRVFFEALSQA